MTAGSFDHREACAAASATRLPDGTPYGAGPGPVIQVRMPYIRTRETPGIVATRASIQYADALARSIDPGARVIARRGTLRLSGPLAAEHRYYTNPNESEVTE